MVYFVFTSDRLSLVALDRLLHLLACPRDHLPLDLRGNQLRCAAGHQYAVFDGIPVLLRDDVVQTHWMADRALAAGASGTLDEEVGPAETGAVDRFVQQTIGATGGFMYSPLTNRLTEYPIPLMPLAPGEGRTLLDVGCNWGRWTIAAARRGYAAIGIDPSLDGVRAARRVCARLGVDADFIVGDARHLPVASASLDTVFSYSVIQHFSKRDARLAFVEGRRVLRPGGQALIQMPNAIGLRCMYHQVRRGFREPKAFEVRYWMPSEVRAAVEHDIGAVELAVDGFLSLNAQAAEAHLLPRRYRYVVAVSDALRRASTRLPWLTAVADSLWVRAVKPDTARD